jgi:hypothetical protein
MGFCGLAGNPLQNLFSDWLSIRLLPIAMEGWGS